MRIRCLLPSVLALGLPFLTGCATFRGDVRTANQGKATKATIYAVCTAIDMFEVDTGRYPTEAEGLKALVANPGGTEWHGPYIRGDTPPSDAWGALLRYTVQDNAYVVESAGADGRFGTQDDIKP